MLAVLSLLLLLSVLQRTWGQLVNITYPSNTPLGAFYVQDNFFGISFEMQIMNTLIGNDPSSIPSPIQAYLGNIRNRTYNPLRLKAGGNSMDDSYYVPTQTVMINGTIDNVNYNPITFGPVLIDTMNALGKSIGGVNWDVGLSLIHINDSQDTVALALYAHNVLGNSLDSYLLGNEPDLYLTEGRRLGQANYTVQNYIDDYANILGQMHGIANLSGSPMAGPTICCEWDLNTVLTNGYLGAFKNFLKYVTVQRYPQSACPGLPPPPYNMSYYTNHFNVIGMGYVGLNGVITALQAGLNVSLTEFNSVSCGGIPGLSNTFGVTLWTIDYALQLAAVGYTSAYIHTREAGIPYNLFSPPAAPIDPNSPGWTTGPPYHALLVVAEALHKMTSPVMSVVDLNLVSPQNTVAGYSIYPAPDDVNARKPPSRFVLFNFAEGSTATFYFTPNYTNIDPSVGERAVSVPGGNITVKYFLASDLNANANISWAGQVMTGGGTLSGVATNTTVTGCDGSGGSSCPIQVPGPGLALVYLDGVQDAVIASQNLSSATGLAGNGTPTPSDPSGVLYPARGKKSLETRTFISFGISAATALLIGVVIDAI